MSDERTNPPPAAPVHFDHYCDYPGCVKWGSFGKERGHGIIEWRRAEHLAPTTGMGDPTREASGLAQRNKLGFLRA